VLTIAICLLSSERSNAGGGGGRSGHENVLPVINLQSTIDVQDPSFAFRKVVQRHSFYSTTVRTSRSLPST